MSDPRTSLGVSAAAGPEEIRAAYLRKVKEFPPERCPEEFEAIRDAFESLGDPRTRTMALLLSDHPHARAASLVDDQPHRRSYAGPQAWLDVISPRGARK